MYKSKYKNGIENSIVGGNIEISVITEESEKAALYALLKISLFGKNTYGLYALGEGHSFEIIGDDEAEAEKFFKTVLASEPSPDHIFDIVTDYRREMEING